MRVVLLSTYELGHQPFGLASPAAWLRQRGHEVACVDLAVSALPSLVIREADVVAFYLPMHTATRLAAEVVGKVRLLNPRAGLIGYGLYAPLNVEYLRGLGVETAIGGEFEEELVRAVEGSAAGEAVSLGRLAFVTPDRQGLPVLSRYARLRTADGTKVVGYTEASRGCKHLCRHCPVVPVYQGVFRVVPVAVVLEDIRRQVAAGAEHLTFGDPDFFNGPGHAMRIVEAMHAEFPGLTYDATIKIEHLLRQRDLLARLRATGCLFVTSAVESVDDAVLARLEKGHTRRDFREAVALARDAGLTLAPTFIPFTPWTTWESYRDLLAVLAEMDLVENTGSVQLALRLLIPAGSRVLELEEARGVVRGWDARALLYRWRHPDASLDALAESVLRTVATLQKQRKSRREIFGEVWRLANGEGWREEPDRLDRAAVPYLDEPWYC